MNGVLERQVRARALEVLELLMRATEQADADRNGQLLGCMPDDELERRLLAAVMRAVILVAAEQRGLPTGALSGRLFARQEFALPAGASPHASGIASADVIDDRLAARIRERLSVVDGENGRDVLAWAELPVEAIGGVYESLIALGVRAAPGAEGRRIVPARTRKRTGSFYTPKELTAEVVSRALEPLFARAVGPDAERRLLALRVCDPALGAGAFLVEACRQLARRLAAISTATRAPQSSGRSPSAAFTASICRRWPLPSPRLRCGCWSVTRRYRWASSGGSCAWATRSRVSIGRRNSRTCLLRRAVSTP